MPKQIGYIVGSLRRDSINRKLAMALIRLGPPDFTFKELRINDLPLYNQDDDQSQAPEVQRLKSELRAVDAVIFVTPEYNYSVPGVLKNAIDWASRPYGDSAWSGKPAAIMGASIGGIATARAQYHLRQMMVFLDMFPLNRPEVMIGNASERFDDAGNLTDESTREHIRGLLRALLDWTHRLRGSQA